MKKSKPCIIAGIILGAFLFSIPCNAKTEYTELQGDCIELSQEDAQLLMQIAQAEAGNQGIDGMWLVMSCVMNRVSDPDWPDSISKVIYQKSQFAQPAKVKDISSDAHLALAKLESGLICPEIMGFEVKTSAKLTRYFDEAFEYKDHKFFTKNDK